MWPLNRKKRCLLVEGLSATPSMRKGRDGEKKNGKNGMEWKMENNGENSGPLTSLPVDRLTPTDCNAAARAKITIRGLTLAYWPFRATFAK